MEEAIRELLVWCYYIEDIQAAKHFVFHQRMNLCSNVCILCHCGAEGEFWEEGHEEGCPYPAAVAEALEHETLADYCSRK